MRSPRLARVVLAASAAAALATAGAVPASAQAQPTLGVFFNNVTIPTAGPGSVQRITLFAAQRINIENPVLSLDFSAIASFATVAKGSQGSLWDCTTTADVLTCGSSTPLGFESALSILPEFVVAPTAGAAAGDEGNLRVTVKGDNVAPARYDARVRTGTPVDLAAGPGAEKEAAVGTSFGHTLQVTNVGDTVVDGVTLLFYNDLAFRAGAKFSNCTYVDDEPRTCRFDRVLNPGGKYQVVYPYTVGADTRAPSEQYAEYAWLTEADLEDHINETARYGYNPGKPGPSGTLQLTEVSSVAARGTQTDTDPTNNWTSLALQVTGENKTDLSAVGAKLTGAVGSQSVAAVGVKNNGPAAIDRSRAGSDVAQVHVVIPPGTTAVAAPKTCVSESEDGKVRGNESGQPGQPRYYCSGGSSILRVGATATFEFTLRIDQVIPDAAGSVATLVPCACDATPLEWDRDHSNNTASIVVNPTSAPSEGPVGANAPALPNTGTRVSLIVGVGGLLVLLGAAAIVWARRRSAVTRTRH